MKVAEAGSAKGVAYSLSETDWFPALSTRRSRSDADERKKPRSSPRQRDKLWRPLPFRTVECREIVTAENLWQPAAAFQQSLGFSRHLTLLQVIEELRRPQPTRLIEGSHVIPESGIVAERQVERPLRMAIVHQLADHPLIGDIDGVGLIGAVEVVADNETEAMDDPDLKVMPLIDRLTRKHGLITRLIGDRIALAPPQTISAPEIEVMFGRLSVALDEAVGLIGR